MILLILYHQHIYVISLIKEATASLPSSDSKASLAIGLYAGLNYLHPFSN